MGENHVRITENQIEIKLYMLFCNRFFFLAQVPLFIAVARQDKQRLKDPQYKLCIFSGSVNKQEINGIVMGNHFFKAF